MVLETFIYELSKPDKLSKFDELYGRIVVTLPLF